MTSMRSSTVVWLVVATAFLLLVRHQQPVRAQVRAVTVATAAGAPDLRAWDATVDRMRRDDTLRLRQATADTMLPGRVIERLDQFYKGVPVYGGDVARQVDGGVTVSIFGTVYEDIDLAVEPGLSPDDARQIVERLAGVQLGPSKTPTLA